MTKVRARKKYINTNAKTKIVKNITKQRVNIMGLIMIILYRNIDTWMGRRDILAEMHKDGVFPSDATLDVGLLNVSGHNARLVARCQRDSALRRDCVNPSHPKQQHEYKFNRAGRQVGSVAALNRIHMNITAAAFTTTLPNTK